MTRNLPAHTCAVCGYRDAVRMAAIDETKKLWWLCNPCDTFAPPAPRVDLRFARRQTIRPCDAEIDAYGVSCEIDAMTGPFRYFDAAADIAEHLAGAQARTARWIEKRMAPMEASKVKQEQGEGIRRRILGAGRYR